MPIVTRVTLKCDVCTHESRPEEGKSPKRWIIFDREHPMEERSFVTTVVCPDCQRKIHQAQTRCMTPSEIDLLHNKP